MDVNKVIIKNQTLFFRSMISDINKTHCNKEKHIKLSILKHISIDHHKMQNIFKIII